MREAERSWLDCFSMELIHSLAVAAAHYRHLKWLQQKAGLEMGRDFFMKQKRTLLEITHSGNKGQSLPNS